MYTLVLWLVSYYILVKLHELKTMSCGEILGCYCFVMHYKAICKNTVNEGVCLKRKQTEDCYHFFSVCATVRIWKNWKVYWRLCFKQLSCCIHSNVCVAASIHYFVTAKQVSLALFSLAVENKHLVICLLRKYIMQLLRESLHTKALLCQRNNALCKGKKSLKNLKITV